jgi:glycosyltransferase involved in cell wall biosynthesis
MLVGRVPTTTRPRIVAAARTIGWRVVLPLLRWRARRRERELRPGKITVLTVNWNSREQLDVLIETVARLSPPGTEVLVVDNASRDGSRERLAADRRIDAILLPVNVGHDLALDLGVLSCDTEYVVALDVDAFPLHDRWLQQLLAPLKAGARVSGARLNRAYVHPCCWAMRTARFVEQRHSFRSRYRPRRHGRDASGDVGEEISAREAPDLYFFDVVSQRGPGDVGTVFGGLVYHNFYATRFRATGRRRLDGVVERDDAVSAWDEALRRYVR